MDGASTPPGAGRPVDPDGAIDAHDLALLADLAATWDRVDPMPAGLVERARFAVALEEVEVEVAHLLETSADRASDLAGVRGATTGQSLTMTFAATAMTVTLAVNESGRDRFRVDGWLTGGQEAEVVLRREDDARTKQVGADGRFVFADVPPGMVQVIVEAAPGVGPAVVTPVFEL